MGNRNVDQPGNIGNQSNVIFDLLFPSILNLIPPNPQSQDFWVLNPNPHPIFNIQWVQCSYPISGGYGPPARFIFYALALFAILMRRNAWIVGAAMGSVMTYSATAAVHAIVLVGLRTSIVPSWLYEDPMLISASANGTWASGVPNVTREGIWLPVLPMAWDNDVDPVLAIVGFAFLALLPMQLWSNTFKRYTGKTVLFLWGGLLFIGTISALVNWAYVSLYAFPQLRFCPLGYNDTLPFANTGHGPLTESVPRVRPGKFYWNDAVVDYFMNTPKARQTNCIYPCFASEWRLRDRTEVTVTDMHTGYTADSATGWWLVITVYIMVLSSSISSLTVLAVNLGRARQHQIISSFRVVSEPIARLWHSSLATTIQICKNVSAKLPRTCKNNLQKVKFFAKRPRKYLSTVRRMYLLCIFWYARVMGPLGLLFFVVWIEWYIYTTDPGGENFRHVGQWGALVAAVLVGVAAVVGHLMSSRPDNQTSTSPTVTV